MNFLRNYLINGNNNTVSISKSNSNIILSSNDMFNIITPSTVNIITFEDKTNGEIKSASFFPCVNSDPTYSCTASYGFGDKISPDEINGYYIFKIKLNVNKIGKYILKYNNTDIETFDINSTTEEYMSSFIFLKDLGTYYFYYSN
jgi:hypothetical protein